MFRNQTLLFIKHVPNPTAAQDTKNQGA